MKTELTENKHVALVAKLKKAFPFIKESKLILEETLVDGKERKTIYFSCVLDSGPNPDKTKMKREWNENFCKLPSQFEGFNVSAKLLNI